MRPATTNRPTKYGLLPIVLITALALTGCGPRTYVAYNGPRRANSEVARLTGPGGVRLYTIDGRDFPRTYYSAWNASFRVELLPGSHSIQGGIALEMTLNDPNPPYTGTTMVCRTRTPVGLSFTALPGEQYQVCCDALSRFLAGLEPGAAVLAVVDRSGSVVAATEPEVTVTESIRWEALRAADNGPASIPPWRP